MEKLLENQVAVITGASRGIGRQIARSMAEEGAIVIINYNGSKARADRDGRRNPKLWRSGRDIPVRRIRL